MIGINLFFEMCQLCVENINDIPTILCWPPAAARDETRDEKGLHCAEEKKQFEAGTKGIRSLLRVNLFSFFSSNYKVYISVTYLMQSETKRRRGKIRLVCEKCFRPALKCLFCSWPQLNSFLFMLFFQFIFPS